jgi:hypothetical protein
LFVVFIPFSQNIQLNLNILSNETFSFFEYRYSPLSPADFFAAAATASYLPAAAAAAASATTLSPSTGKSIHGFLLQLKQSLIFKISALLVGVYLFII